MTPREQWRLQTRRLGRTVLVYDCVDSTNSQAANLASHPENDGIVILADEQTAGRGQHGRSWTCQNGLGVLLSVLLFPPASLRRPVLLAAWAAVSVCETIHRVAGLQATIKWPNDVLVEGRKVCGILIEQAQGTVVGIGLNVNQTRTSMREAGLPQAGSLAWFTDRSHDVHEVARVLIRELDQAYDRLCDGELQELEDHWKSGTGLLGKRVVVEAHDADYHGIVRDLGWAGVKLEVESVGMQFLVPETIRRITPSGSAK